MDPAGPELPPSQLPSWCPSCSFSARRPGRQSESHHSSPPRWTSQSSWVCAQAAWPPLQHSSLPLPPGAPSLVTLPPPGLCLQKLLGPPPPGGAHPVMPSASPSLHQASRQPHGRPKERTVLGGESLALCKTQSDHGVGTPQDAHVPGPPPPGADTVPLHKILNLSLQAALSCGQLPSPLNFLKI